MASFAVGRAQQLIYLLHVLQRAQRIPAVPIYLDSPMSINATHIYLEHGDDHDLSEAELTGSQAVIDGPQVVFTKTTDESKALNKITGPAVIISSSGMMTGGRILHHLRRRLPSEKNTVVLGGYMAFGTRGRLLQDGAESIRMHGQEVPVRAAIETVSGLSGHADRDELLRWLDPLGDPHTVFLTHGEPESSKAFSAELVRRRQWKVVIPQLGDAHEQPQRRDIHLSKISEK